MTTWITDGRGNRASVECWGSEEAARASLATLQGCTDCTDCMYCTNCRDCMYCTDCRDCTNCRYCMYCTNCADCRYCTNCRYCMYCTNCADCTNCIKVKDAKNPLVVGSFRSDGFQFVMGDKGSIHAGCRVFADMASARDHWTKTRGGTPLGDETAIILDHLEALAKRRLSSVVV